MRVRDSAYLLAVWLGFLYFLHELVQVNSANLKSAQPRKLISIIATPDFNDRVVQKACNMVNAKRSKINASDMLKLQTNKNITKTIKEFLAMPYSGTLEYVPNHNLPLTYADWGYNQDYAQYNVTKPLDVNSYTNFHIMNLHPLFLQIAAKYQVLDLVKKTMLVGHDTWKAQNFPNGAFKILNLRLNQGHCLSYSNCLRPLTFDFFQSCSLYPDVNNLPRKCLWFYWYYPALVYSRGQIFSWVNLHIPGRFVGNLAQTQAWLFVIFLKDNQPVSSNIPYKRGLACSDCPPESTCEKKLCIMDSSKKLTSSPTLTFSRQPNEIADNSQKLTPAMNATKNPAAKVKHALG